MTRSSSASDPLDVALSRKARSGEPGSIDGRVVGAGTGWRAIDVLCTLGPRDRPFEERQPSVAISLVLSGVFSYRGERGVSLVSPGALLLMTQGQIFECARELGRPPCLSAVFPELAYHRNERRAPAAPDDGGGGHTGCGFWTLSGLISVTYMADECAHTASIRTVTPSARGCEECLAIGSPWVHLRLCRTCGHVGCCDSSPNRHATEHFHETRHPIIEGYDPPEGWGWCYVGSRSRMSGEQCSRRPLWHSPKHSVACSPTIVC